MLKPIFSIGTAVFLLWTASPAVAMMGGSGGGMWDMARGLFQQQPDLNQPVGQGHYHGDYYHVHEGGAVYHEHQPSRSGAERTGSAQEAPAAVRIDPKQSTSSTRPTRENPQADTARGKSEKKAVGSSKHEAPHQTVQWSDDVMLHLVSAQPETATGSAAAGSAAESVSFYMDETRVTNHQYVDFLNRVLPRVQVEQNVVRGDGRIWLMLGEVKPGYEPIVFDGRAFQMSGIPYTASAVMRVSADGAAAYAAHYGKRLPSREEWLAASGSTPAEGSTPEPAGDGRPLSELLRPPNGHGLRGLNVGIGEWTVESSPSTTANETGEPRYVIMGPTGIKNRGKPVSTEGLARHPWEAFADVGFRTVISRSQVQQDPRPQRQTAP